jgi:hypothetical protein
VKILLKITPYNSSMIEGWDHVVRSSRTGTFLHLRSYMDYHSDRFDDCSIFVSNESGPVAVFPAHRVGDCVASHDGLTFGGLITIATLRGHEVREIFCAIIAHYKELGFSRMRYKPVPHIFHNYPAEDDLHQLFLLDSRIISRDISPVIDLSARLKISKSRKDGIRKAKKRGLAISEGGSLCDFHCLLSKVLAQHNVRPVHSIAELELLQQRHPEWIRLVNIVEDGSLLAGAWLFMMNKVLHTQYLAASDEGRACGALDFLISEIISEAAINFDYISFGRSTENGGRFVNEGLEFQKEGFGARNTTMDQYEVML